MNAVTLTSSFPATVQPGIPKLTETPEGWTRAPLGQFLREVRRPVKMMDDHTYKLVTVKRARGGVVERGSFLGRDVLVKSQFRIEAGDFLISKRQIVHGACGVVPDALAGSIVSNEYSILNGNDGIDINFLNYLAHSVFFQQTCFHSSIGVHIEKMIFKLDRWLKFEFNLPPLPEQRKIVDILSIWDAAIEKTEALLATARTGKRALMQSLLTGRRRFAEFEGQPWKEVRLGDVSRSWSGGTPSRKRPEFFGGSIPWIKSGEVNAARVTTTEESITEEALATSSANMVEPGNILVAMYGATAGVVSIAGISAAINQAILAIEPSPLVETSFLHRSLELAMDKTKRLTQGGQPNLNAAIIRATKLFLPTTAEQVKIANVINAAQDEIDHLENAITKLRTEKKALMQQLLTGKRRVVV